MMFLKKFITALICSMGLVVGSPNKEQGPQIDMLMSAMVNVLFDVSDEYTLFAPNDKAFKESGLDFESISNAQMYDILAYHMVPQAAIKSSALLEGAQRVPTLQGGEIMVVKSSKIGDRKKKLKMRKGKGGVDEDKYDNSKVTTTVTINGAKVVQADIEGALGEGVVHIIDRLLLPLPLPKNMSSSLSSSSTSELMEKMNSMNRVNSTGLATAERDATTATTTDLIYNNTANMMNMKKVLSSNTSSSLSSLASSSSSSSASSSMLSSRTAPALVSSVLSTQTYTLADTVTRLQQAITTGVPLYNSGDIEGCKQVYLDAAYELVSSNSPASSTLLESISIASGQNASNGAWTLRRAFDSIINSATSTTTTIFPTTTTASTIAPASLASTVLSSSTRTTYVYDMSMLRWNVINDSVMGGVSSSNVNVQNGIVLFEGFVTTQNNGGFVTARGESTEGSINLSACPTGVQFESRGTPGRYSFSVRNGRGWRGGEFESDFYPTSDSQWSTHTFNFNAAPNTFMGQTLPGQLNSSQVSGFGLKKSAYQNGLNKDPQFRDGSFSLEVRGVKCI